MFYRTITRGKMHIQRITPGNGAMRICGKETRRNIPESDAMPNEVILRGLRDHRHVKVCTKCEEVFRNEVE